MDSSTLRRFAGRRGFRRRVRPALRRADAVVYSSRLRSAEFLRNGDLRRLPGCLDIGTGFATNGVGGCTVTWLTANVTLVGSPNANLDYGPLLPDPGIISSIFVEDGELAGIISGALGSAIVSGHPDPTLNGPVVDPVRVCAAGRHSGARWTALERAIRIRCRLPVHRNLPPTDPDGPLAFATRIPPRRRRSKPSRAWPRRPSPGRSC